MSYNDLPYAAQVVCFCEDKEGKKSKKFAPDPRLQNWEKWMKCRKKVNDHMGKHLDRYSEQLLYNYSEDLCSIREEKAVLENTNIIHPHDRYRGNPAFWNMPMALQRKPCQPDYFSVMTKKQRCEIPTMEYVGVPNVIRKEKISLTTGYRNPKIIWDESRYRQQRTEELSVEIQNVEPYKPNLNDLFVKGVAILNKTESSQLKEPSVENIVAEDQKKEPVGEIHKDDKFLLIDDRKLDSHVTADINIYRNFEYDINSRDLFTKNIDIENGTPYALRYHLTTKKNFFLFRDVQKTEEQVFFYDKMELVMLPNQKFELPISFKSKFPSTYKLQLELHTRPKLWDCCFIINLLGVSSYYDITAKSEDIKNYIDSKAHEAIVKDTIHDILNDIPAAEESNPVFYVYDKAMIFEAVNQNFGPITQRPKYIYNKEIVEELENFYYEVRLPGYPPTWNYNIEELREVTKRRQELNYQNKFVDELLVIKTGEIGNMNTSLGKITPKSSKLADRSLAKVTSKSSKLMKSQQELKADEKSDKSVRKLSKLGKSAQLDESKIGFGKNLVSDLENILLKLQQPSVWVNGNKTLHESCYTIFCTALDTIMRNIQQLEVDMSISRSHKYPRQYTYELHSFQDRIEEVHDNLPGQIPRIQEDFIKEALPAAECLKSIPFDECDVRYKTYYGLTEEAPQQGKGKKKGKKEKSPKKKEKVEKKSKKHADMNKQDIKETVIENIPDVNLKENINFNISEEICIEIDPSIKQSISSDEDISSEFTSGLLQREYKRSLYDIFYKNILEAALKITDIIELCKTRNIKLENARRTLLEISSRDPPAEIKLLDLKQALRFALDLPVKYQPRYDVINLKEEEKPSKFEESIQLKEEGSEWSILKPPKGPEESLKPISYAEGNVYLKKRLGKRIFKDIGTIMSNAGIHPGWVDFKEIGVQVISKGETRVEKEDFVSNIVEGVVSKICTEEAAAEAKYEDIGEESTSSDEIFYDEDVSNITNAITEPTVSLKNP